MLRFFLFIALCGFAAESRVLGIGASTIDLLIHVDDDFISKYIPAGKGGSCACSATLIDEVLAASHKEPKVVPGGNAANTIRALSQLGERCAFLGWVGLDRFGDSFCHNLENLGVEERLMKSADISTSKVLCLVSHDGQRSFLGFDPYVTDMQAQEEDFKGVNWVHFEARRLNSGFDVERAMRLAKEAGAKISIDLSSANVIHKHRETLLQLLAQYVDVVFCNEMEIDAMFQLSPEEGCRELQKICPVAVVTIGAKGCLVGHNSEIFQTEAFPAQILDTTGAGDYFAAGFIYGCLHEYPLRICAQLGNRLGAAIVEVVGAELPDSKWEEIRTTHFLAQKG